MQLGPFLTTQECLIDGETRSVDIEFVLPSECPNTPKITAVLVHGEPVDPLLVQEIAEQLHPEDLLTEADIAAASLADVWAPCAEAAE